jgi:acetyl esterase/lipase
VLSAISWVRTHSAEYGVNTDRLALFGTSAGANLAAEAATDAQALGSRVMGIAAVVSYSGPLNLSSLAGGSEPPAITALIENYVGCTLAACPSTYVAASPISHVTSSSPPMFLANSSDEVIPVAQATSMAAELRSAGVPEQVDVIPGKLHGSAYAPEAFRSSVEFLSTYLGAFRGRVPRIPPTSSGLVNQAGLFTNPASTNTLPPRASTATTSGLHPLPVVVAGLIVLAVLVLAFGAQSRMRRR